MVDTALRRPRGVLNQVKTNGISSAKAFSLHLLPKKPIENAAGMKGRRKERFCHGNFLHLAHGTGGIREIDNPVRRHKSLFSHPRRSLHVLLVVLERSQGDDPLVILHGADVTEMVFPSYFRILVLSYHL